MFCLLMGNLEMRLRQKFASCVMRSRSGIRIVGTVWITYEFTDSMSEWSSV
jgi:hypothetical protein